MDLLPSPEQDEIISSSAAFLRGSLPSTRTRELIDEPSNVDAKVWQAAAELGWFALGLAEDAGGVGCGLADEALLFREIGRALATGPFLSTTLAARVAALGGQSDLATAIAGGQQVGLAVLAEGATYDGKRLNGDVQLFDATEAELVLVATPASASLFRVADLSDVAPAGCLDPGTRLKRATAASVTPVVTLGAETDPVWRRGLVLLAALLSGVAEATRDISAEHAKTRVQFDRPIGVHQAVKHPCADMAVRAELAWAQTVVAALATDEGRVDAEFQALSAKVVAAEAADLSSRATVQVLGGMGFTFEHDANLYVKRSFVLGHLFGDRRDSLSRLIELPGAL